MATSNAGQLRGCTILGANNNMATENPILTNSHDKKLTALLVDDIPGGRPVVPRANKTPGTTAVAAPYSIDHITTVCPVSNHPIRAATTPSTACTAITCQGDTDGMRAFKAAASS